MLRIIDQRWREHLYEMDHLREGIHLRAMGQRDPTTEWQREGFELFGHLTELIGADFLRYVMRVQVRSVDETSDTTTHIETSHSENPSGNRLIGSLTGGDNVPAAEAPPKVVQRVKNDWDSTPRNAPCPCGSSRKFKHCHGR